MKPTRLGLRSARGGEIGAELKLASSEILRFSHGCCFICWGGPLNKSRVGQDGSRDKALVLFSSLGGTTLS